MYYYVEEWKPKREWFDMTPEDRGKSLFDHSPAIQNLIDNGAELVGYCVNLNDQEQPVVPPVWVRPTVEVEYRQRLRDGLRHAALEGIRPDKRPRLIRRPSSWARVVR